MREPLKPHEVPYEDVLEWLRATADQHMRPKVRPVHEQDQLDAAVRDMPFPVPPGDVPATPEELERRHRLMAAVLRCPTACPHIQANANQPTFIQLGLHRADCRRCLAIDRQPPPDEADRCDVCGSRGNTEFTGFAVQIANTFVEGHAGACCADWLG